MQRARDSSLRSDFIAVDSIGSMSSRGEPAPAPGRPQVSAIPGLALGEGIERLAWKATRVRGVSWLPLRLDEGESSGNRRPGGTVLIRMEPGCGYAPHRHVGAEDVLVLQGGYRDEFGQYVQGDHVHYPAGSRHSPVALGASSASPRASVQAGVPACVLLANVALGIELLESG